MSGGLFGDLPDDPASGRRSAASGGRGRRAARGDRGATRADDDAKPGGRRPTRVRGAVPDRASVKAWAQVAPPVPVAGLFTYAVPDALAGRVVPGVRVLVPFGGRTLRAMVVHAPAEPPPDDVTVRAIVSLQEDEPLVDADVLELGAWVARGTGCSVGEALDAMLPSAVRAGRSGRRVEQAVLLLPAPSVAGAVDDLMDKRPQQARALRVLADAGGTLPVQQLMERAHVTRSPVTSLAKAGHLRLERVELSRDPLLGLVVGRRAPHRLTDEQARVRERIVGVADACFARAAAGGAAAWGSRPPVFLLHGVTGSGKTEIYLQVLDHVVRSGRQGIVLVPEISLTPQTVRRFRERFERVAVLHSHLTDADRQDQWRRIRRGEADVVVGARSAVFAPVPRLGLVILDEEHETSFKQGSVPRYHAREVAVERARLAGAVALFGTATPSLEAYERARRGEYERIVLDERVAGGRTPDVQVVDLTIEERRDSGSHVTDPLEAAMRHALARNEQVILFLNRRGWAPVMLCRSCRAGVRCQHCDVSLTLHRRIGRLLCHYCGHEERPPTTCKVCGTRLAPLGFGTEKVEDEVRRIFPGVSVARMDSDTMSGRGSHAVVLDRFAAGEVSVLVGTQMIAKGLDFPNATVVGVICADSALFLPDYRAAERTFQLLAQVVGRTGRGPQGGRVVIQAYDPQHFAIRAGMNQDYESFARTELPTRQESGYPPYGRLLRVVVQGRDEDGVRARVRGVADALRDGLGLDALGLPADESDASDAQPWLQLLGPAPAPIPRIAQQHRHHLLLKARDDAGIDAALAVLAHAGQSTAALRVLVDVDPVALL